jgi:Pectinacetylesterase
VGDNRVVAALARAVVVALIALAAGSVGQAAGQATPRWEKVEPGGRTACARGGPFAYWVRRADPSKVVIFFQGGGGCWDATTCAAGSTWFDDRVSVRDDPNLAAGIFAFWRPENPFRDWSFVYVPSCTGDVYMGTRDTTYAPGLRVRHRGAINARAALAGAFRAFPAPRQVLVAGCSAGSVGAAFHIARVLARYPRARVALLGDSLAFPFTRPLDLSTWGASPRFEMEPFLRRLARAHPRQTFARFNYASDDVQERYDATRERTPFERRLRAAETRLKRLPNYRSYLACGGDHCVLPADRFYRLRVGGVALRDWTARLAAGRNVSCPTCPGR